MTEELAFVHDTFHQMAREGRERALVRLVHNLALVAQGQVALAPAGERGFPRTLSDEVRPLPGRPPSAPGQLVQEWIRTESERPPVLADLAVHPGLAFPWHPTRFVRNLAREEPWRYDRMNHRAYFLEPLGIVVFENGLHSGWRGVLDREGRLPAIPLDLGRVVREGLRVEVRGAKAFWTVAPESHRASPLPEANATPVRWPWWALAVTATRALVEAGHTGTILPPKESWPC